MRGAARSIALAVQDSIEAGIRRSAEGICAAHGTAVAMRYERRYPATVNTGSEPASTGRRVRQENLPFSPSYSHLNRTAARAYVVGAPQ